MNLSFGFSCSNQFILGTGEEEKGGEVAEVEVGGICGGSRD